MINPVKMMNPVCQRFVLLTDIPKQIVTTDFVNILLKQGRPHPKTL